MTGIAKAFRFCRSSTGNPQLSNSHHQTRPPGSLPAVVGSHTLPQDKIADVLKAAQFRDIDLLVAHNLARVARAWHSARDHDRSTKIHAENTLDEVVANIMGTDAAISRVELLSGTHAITVGLFACLQPKDEILCVTGDPYDTLEEVLGVRGQPDIGNLEDWGVTHRCHQDLVTPEGGVHPASVTESINIGRTRVCHIQRSCGYSLRPTLTIEEIGAIVRSIRDADESIIITVDNCYGEFTQELEPGHVGADLVMGSFIKNPGGTLATGGGYVAGRGHLVERARMHIGQTSDKFRLSQQSRQILQGLSLAPSCVGEALKGGRLLVHCAQMAGITAQPLDIALQRPSFITALELGSEDAMVQFCQMVQMNSPVGSYVLPVGAATPGYENSVVFADGTFINGCTAELSADGPLRQPYVVFCQGGSHWVQWLRIAGQLGRFATKGQSKFNQIRMIVCTSTIRKAASFEPSSWYETSIAEGKAPKWPSGAE